MPCKSQQKRKSNVRLQICTLMIKKPPDSRQNSKQLLKVPQDSKLNREQLELCKLLRKRRLPDSPLRQP